MEGWRSLIFSQNCPHIAHTWFAHIPRYLLSPCLARQPDHHRASGCFDQYLHYIKKKASVRDRSSAPSVRRPSLRSTIVRPSTVRRLAPVEEASKARRRTGSQDSWAKSHHHRALATRSRCNTKRDQQHNYHQVLMTQCSHQGPVIQSRTRLVRVSESSISHPAREPYHSQVQNVHSPSVIK